MFLSTAQNHPWAPDLYTWMATIITRQHVHNWNDTFPLQACFSPRFHTSIKHAVRQFIPQANMLVISLLPFSSEVHPISEIPLQLLFSLGSVSAPWLDHFYFFISMTLLLLLPMHSYLNLLSQWGPHPNFCSCPCVLQITKMCPFFYKEFQ